MYSKFEGLPEDRKNKILEICIEEFADKGYEKASTNTMVKKAGISKGILFHYFGSKKGLYLYLVDFIINHFILRFYEIDVNSSPDIFERISQRSLRKLKLAYEEPLNYQFAIAAFADVPEELKEDIEQRRRKLYAEHIPAAFSGIDTSKFRKGIDPQKAMEIIVVCMDAVGNKYLSQFKDRKKNMLDDIENILETNREYIEILKGGIYGPDV